MFSNAKWAEVTLKCNIMNHASVEVLVNHIGCVSSTLSEAEEEDGHYTKKSNPYCIQVKVAAQLIFVLIHT